MSQIIEASKLNVNNVTATKPKLNKGKRLNSILLYSRDDESNKIPLYLETPKVLYLSLVFQNMKKEILEHSITVCHLAQGL